MTPREERDGWGKAEITFGAIGALGSILIPIALFVLGRQLTNQQQEQSDAQLKADRVERMLSHLASTNDYERKLTIKALGYLASVDQFPRELVSAVVEVASSDSHEDVSNTATAVLQTVRDSKEADAARVAQQGLDKLPPRVNVHVQASDPNADAAIADLKRDNVVVAVQQATAPPAAAATKTELSYYRKEDKDKAEEIARSLALKGIQAELRDRSQQVEAKTVRPRGFDLVIQKKE